MKKSIFNSIKRATDIGSLNLEKHCTGAPFRWRNKILTIDRLFCSYGQIGYTVNVEGERGTIQIDCELNKTELDGDFE